MCCILIYISSRIYENRTSGLLEATHLKLTQLKYILPRNSALTHVSLKVTLLLVPDWQKTGTVFWRDNHMPVNTMLKSHNHILSGTDKTINNHA